MLVKVLSAVMVLSSNAGLLAQEAKPASHAPSAASESSAPARDELLALGFDAASSIPKDPHDRDRAVVQEAVARASVQVGCQTRAMAMANQIDGWRAGMVWTELALDAARERRADPVRAYARFALASIGTARDWQRDRVRIRVAQAYAWIGDDAAAAELAKGVGEAEQGKLGTAQVARGTGVTLDEAILAAEAAIATKSLDLTVNALDTLVEVAAKCPGDEQRWARVLALVDSASSGVPRDIHIRSYLRLADARTAQGAREKSRELVGRARAIRDAARWMPESEPPLAADIARRLHALGDHKEALAELERALASFEASKAKVADVFRAAALRPAAEAYAAMGEESRAREIFAQAVEQGALNPNARPRAMDLAETCAAIARSGVSVEPSMWKRLRAIREGLTDPW